MDPVSIGLAAAGLIAIKFVESSASEAGKSAWKALVALRTLVANKLKRPELLTPHSDSQAIDSSTLASEITNAANEDTAFQAELDRIISEIQNDPAGNRLIAHAQDNAKQANIAGNNSGNITFS